MAIANFILRVSLCCIAAVAVFAVVRNHYTTYVALHVVFILVQLMNLFVLFNGWRRKVFNDPIYFFWIGFSYGLADLWNLTVMTLRYSYSQFLPEEFFRKWAGYLGSAFGWGPSMSYQFALSVYCALIVHAPLWYFSNKNNVTFRRRVMVVAFVIEFGYVIFQSPLLIEGYHIDLRRDRLDHVAELKPGAKDLDRFYNYFNKVIMSLTLLTYVSVFAQSLVGKAKAQYQDKAMIVRLVVPPVLSWTMTAAHVISGDHLKHYVYVPSTVIRFFYFAHYSGNPVIQLVRNSDYRDTVRHILDIEQKKVSIQESTAA